MEKAVDAYRTISEVAEDLDLPQHVLRFWETRFAQIKPLKRGGGRRYYRPEDVDLLKGIRHLLYGEGFTIRGVQRILKDQGPRAVIALGRGEGAQQAAAKPEGPDVVDRKAPLPPETAGEPPQPVLRPALAPPIASVVPLMAPKGPARIEPAPPASMPSQPSEIRMSPREADIATPEPARLHPMPPRPQSVPFGLQAAARPRPAETDEEHTFSASRPAAGLSREEVRLLQATLYELAECKRLLDAALAERAENA